MARRRDSFASALASLRLRGLRGDFTPGQSVVVVDEARRLKLSPTPVREALACLCGEGLFERSPNEGFLFPRLDAAIIRDRLSFRLTLLLISLGPPSIAMGAPTALSEEAPAMTLMRHLARVTRANGNVALFEADRRVAGQLAPLRHVEKKVLGDVAQEATDLLTVFATGDVAACAKAVTSYHQRRIDAAPLLLLELEGGLVHSPSSL